MKKPSAILWVSGLALLAGLLAWQIFRTTSREVNLPLINRTPDPVALEFYGSGLRQPMATILGAGSQSIIQLPVQTSGEMRVRIATPRLRNDAVLLNDVALLRNSPQQFEVGSGGTFVLTALP